MAYESLKQEIRQYIKTNGQNEITGQILQDVLVDMVNQYPSLDGCLHPTINNLADGDILRYISGAWRNTSLSAILNGYATESWVDNNYLPKDGGTMYGNISFGSGYGITVTYQHGDPSDPEYDTIDIRDGIISVGNGGSITIGGNEVATQSWVSANYATQSTVNGLSYINGITGDDLGHLTLTGHNFATTVLDLTHQHRWEELIDVPTTIQDYGITDAYISSGTIYLGGNSITPMPAYGCGYGTTYGDCFTLSWGATIQYRLGVNFGCDQTNGTYIEFFTRNGQFTGTKIETGQITSAAFVVPNGTSSQFLKADGSIDTNAYITSAALSGYATQSWVDNNYLPKDGGTMYGNISFGSGYGITVTYQHGDPSDPEYDTIDIRDGIISVGNGGSITIGGNEVATQSWVSASYATQSWVSSNYATQSTVNGLSYINGVALNGDGSLSLTGHSFTTTILDMTHQHRWEELTDRPLIDMWNDTMVAVNGIVSSGKIGAGVSSAPSYMLEVNGQAMIYSNVGIGTSPASGISLDIDGTARANSFVNNSDIRKKDVIEYDVDPGFWTIANAPTIRFTWKDRGLLDNRGECVGSIAQYWQLALPEAVMTDGEGYLSMQYDVIALIAAISVAKRVALHEQRIAALERENALLRMDIKALKGEV